MRSFIQYKAGVTFYRDSKVTLAVRKNYIEYVFSLGMGKYGVINLMIFEDQLIFIADCGHLFQVMFQDPGLQYHSGTKMPLLKTLLGGSNSEYFIGSAENQDGKIVASYAILHMEPNDFGPMQHITLASHPKMLETASHMLLFAREVYAELEESDEPAIKQLISAFESY